MKTSLPATTVATINNQQIILIENGEKRIAIKPICQALGVDPDWQNSKIKEDEILGELHKISYATGADGKQYEMATIPFKYVFGWLFSINPKKVSDEARESVVRYKKECYDALYYHFTSYAEFVEFKQKAVDEKLEALKKIRIYFNSAKDALKKASDELEETRLISYSDYKQLKLNFPEERGAE